MIDHPKFPCTKCGTRITVLEAFPGNICLECYRPIGDRIAATMTAEKLTRMWGGRA